MAEKRYHITDDGPKECTARKVQCKYSDASEHYTDHTEAVQAYENKLAEEHGGQIPSQKKISTPQDASRDKNVDITYDTLTPREFDVDADGDVVIPEDIRENLRTEIDAGYIKESVSEDGQYVMLKYTKAAMFDQKWNEATVNFRGVLTDREHRKVYARSFSKFFNVSEHEGRPAFPSLPKDENVVLAKKMDGSLGLIAHVDGENKVYTSGSAQTEDNEIAAEGGKILHEITGSSGWKPPKNVTVLAEIISEKNVIVVDYEGRRDLVVLSAVDNRTGKTLPDDEVQKMTEGFTQVEKIDGGAPMSYEDAMSRPVPSGEEGYVLEFQESGLRAKVKGEEYKQAHSILTNMSAKSLWRSIDEGEDAQLLKSLENAPERAKITVQKAHAEIIRRRDEKMAEREKVVRQAMANYNAKHHEGKYVFSAAEVPKEKMKHLVEELKSAGAEVGSSQGDFKIDISIAKGNRQAAESGAMKAIRHDGEMSVISLVSAEESEVGDDQDDTV